MFGVQGLHGFATRIGTLRTVLPWHGPRSTIRGPNWLAKVALFKAAIDNIRPNGGGGADRQSAAPPTTLAPCVPLRSLTAATVVAAVQLFGGCLTYWPQCAREFPCGHYFCRSSIRPYFVCKSNRRVGFLKGNRSGDILQEVNVAFTRRPLPRGNQIPWTAGFLHENCTATMPGAGASRFRHRFVEHRSWGSGHVLWTSGLGLFA